MIITSFRTFEVIGYTRFYLSAPVCLTIELKQNIKSNFGIKNTIIIGFFQILALIPGVRSGIIITFTFFKI